MTHDEIRSLKPGPEMDRAVAIALDYPTHGEEGGRIYQRGPEGAELLPAYSSTWTGLGLVVEAMERRGYLLTASQTMRNSGNNWTAWFNGDVNGLTSTAETLLEAAASAALLALAAEKGQRP